MKSYGRVVGFIDLKSGSQFLFLFLFLLLMMLMLMRMAVVVIMRLYCRSAGVPVIDAILLDTYVHCC